jgi:hypothetical protein
MLELNFGLDINNLHHIWLLQHLFLPAINPVLSFFAQSWNEHKIEIRDGPNRSPADMFGFDMLVHGVRGDALPSDDLDMIHEELEIFGVDWEALRDENVLRSQRENNDLQERPDIWLGRVGPPPNLNEVQVNASEASLIQTWIHGLATAQNLRPDLF